MAKYGSTEGVLIPEPLCGSPCSPAVAASHDRLIGAQDGASFGQHPSQQDGTPTVGYQMGERWTVLQNFSPGCCLIKKAPGDGFLLGKIQEDMAMGAGHSRMRCHGLGVRDDVTVPPAVSIGQLKLRAHVDIMFPLSISTHQHPATLQYNA